MHGKSRFAFSSITLLIINPIAGLFIVSIEMFTVIEAY
jgi:hypothetical protein